MFIYRDSCPFEPARPGHLTLFSEQGMDYSLWAHQPLDDPHGYPTIIEPGDALVIVDPKVKAPFFTDKVFQDFLFSGCEAVLPAIIGDNIVFSTEALALDFDCNIVDISQDIMRQAAISKGLIDAGIFETISHLRHPEYAPLDQIVQSELRIWRPGIALQASYYPPGSMVQCIHGTPVNGVPENMPPQKWLRAYERGYPAMLAKAKSAKPA